MSQTNLTIEFFFQPDKPDVKRDSWVSPSPENKDTNEYV
jgi:hypothetical protein